jgi:THO complex subunit 1
LFQSFPLGDKSSVNLRGEYHVENVTTYDETPPPKAEQDEVMEVDEGGAKENGEQKQSLKAVTFDPKKTPSGKPPLNTDVFYPLFWSLQDSFSQPKKLFDPAYFARFRGAMETTMTAFRSIQVENGSRSSKTTTPAADDGKRSLKRKRDDGETDLANAFNPKYLTSRDLFELEVCFWRIENERN